MRSRLGRGTGRSSGLGPSPGAGRGSSPGAGLRPGPGWGRGTGSGAAALRGWDLRDSASIIHAGTSPWVSRWRSRGVSGIRASSARSRGVRPRETSGGGGAVAGRWDGWAAGGLAGRAAGRVSGCAAGRAAVRAPGRPKRWPRGASRTRRMSGESAGAAVARTGAVIGRPPGQPWRRRRQRRRRGEQQDRRAGRSPPTAPCRALRRRGSRPLGGCPSARRGGG